MVMLIMAEEAVPLRSSMLIHCAMSVTMVMLKVTEEAVRCSMVMLIMTEEAVPLRYSMLRQCAMSVTMVMLNVTDEAVR